MSLYDFWNGTPPASLTSDLNVTENENAPPWLADITRGLLGTAVNVSEQGYTPYTGPRIADLDPLSQQASTMVQQQVGQWQPELDYSRSAAPGQMSAYMNPYQEQVVDRIAQLGQRNLTENLLPQVNSTFTGAGQFGSTRNMDFTNRALRDTNESILGAQGQLLNQGYQQQFQNFNTDASRMANAASMASQLGTADTTALDLLGRTNQNQNQQNLDLNYQNFLEQREEPKQSLSWLSSVIHGLPVNTATYQNQTTLPPMAQVSSPLQQAAAAFSGVRSLLSPTQQAAQTTQTSPYRT